MGYCGNCCYCLKATPEVVLHTPDGVTRRFCYPCAFRFCEERVDLLEKFGVNYWEFIPKLARLYYEDRLS